MPPPSWTTSKASNRQLGRQQWYQQFFNVTGWTGGGSLTAGGTWHGDSEQERRLRADQLAAANQRWHVDAFERRHQFLADLTVTATTANPSRSIDAGAFSEGETNLSATGTGDAILYGGRGGGTLTAARYGNDILIGEAADTHPDRYRHRPQHPDRRRGRGDTFVGGGNDILVSGTSQCDIHSTGTNIADLDAILAEWASSAS